MHSLTTLNTHSQEFMSFTDDRTYSVTFQQISGANQVAIAEDQPHIVGWQFVIEDMASVDTSGGTISVEITNMPTQLSGGIRVYFQTTAPAGVTLTDLGSGAWTVAGIDTMSDWAFVRDNLIVKPAVDSTAAFDYDVQIVTPGVEVDPSWTVYVTFPSGNVAEMLAPLDQEFDPQVASAITNYAVILDPYNVDESIYTYRVVISPDSIANLDLITTSASGGTVTWDNVNKTLTIVGVKSIVNTHLRSLQVTTNASTTQSDWVLTYSLTNIASGVLTVVTQNFIEMVENLETTNLGVARSYTSNTVANLFPDSVPAIDDGIQSSSQEYTVSVEISDPIGVFGLASDASFPGSGWNIYTQTWSYTGLKTECNTALSNLLFYPNKNTTTATTITYRQYRDSTLQASDTVALTGTARTTAVPGEGTYTFTFGGTSTFTPTFEQAHYMTVEILLVGGGGAGGGVIWHPAHTTREREAYGRVWDQSTGYYMSGGSAVYTYASDALGDFVADYYTFDTWDVGGGGAGGVLYIADADPFAESTSSTVYNITVGNRGSKPTINPNIYGDYTLTAAAGNGSETSIAAAGGSVVYRATGGKGGLSTYSNGDPLLPSGITDPYACGTSGAGYINNVAQQAARASFPRDEIGRISGVDNSSLHPYTLPTTDDWSNDFYYRAYYRRGGANKSADWNDGSGVENAISGSTVEYAGGGGIEYYSSTLTTPGSGGKAGVFDWGPDMPDVYTDGVASNTTADDVGYQFTDGQYGIVIIKFTQP